MALKVYSKINLCCPSKKLYLKTGTKLEDIYGSSFHSFLTVRCIPLEIPCPPSSIKTTQVVLVGVISHNLVAP